MSGITIIPAVDIMEGNCVRLKRGRREEKIIYSNFPGCIAKQWEGKGARRLHIVDLDGAFSGSPQNLPLIERIVGELDIPVELGGGLRSLRHIRCVLNLGVRWAIVGTRAFRDRTFLEKCLEHFGERIILGLDAKEGRLMGEGWLTDEHQDAVDFVKSTQRIGLKTVIYTDVHRDGMLTGPNIKATKQLCEQTEVDVIASGGISSVEDLIALKELNIPSLIGAIVGRALYTGDIDLAGAIETLNGR